MNKTQIYNIKEGEWQPHPVNRGVYIKPILSGEEGLGFKNMYVKIVPGGEIMPHTHDVTEVFLFISGIGSVLVNGEKKECGESTVVVAPAEIEHGIKNNKDKDIYVLANFQS